VPEDYVHRIGRTGRAGATGEAISLVCVDEHAFLRDIERLIKREIESEVVRGFEPDRRAIAQPVQQRQQRNTRGDPSRGKPRPQAMAGASARGGKGGGASARGGKRGGASARGGVAGGASARLGKEDAAKAPTTAG